MARVVTSDTALWSKGTNSLHLNPQPLVASVCKRIFRHSVLYSPFSMQTHKSPGFCDKDHISRAWQTLSSSQTYKSLSVLPQGGFLLCLLECFLLTLVACQRTFHEPPRAGVPVSSCRRPAEPRSPCTNGLRTVCTFLCKVFLPQLRNLVKTDANSKSKTC